MNPENIDLRKIQAALNKAEFPAVGRIKAVANATGFTQADVSRYLSGVRPMSQPFYRELKAVLRERGVQLKVKKDRRQKDLDLIASQIEDLMSRADLTSVILLPTETAKEWIKVLRGNKK